MVEKSVEKTYQKKSPIEHILLRPDTYVGSTEKVDQMLWVFDEKSQKFKEKKIEYAPGLYKIFDEILVNAADNYQRDPRGCTQIKVNIDKAKNQISIFNNGKTMPVVIHKEHKVYVPELVFGHLLTSSNYDDAEKKTTGGRNGYGAKLTNIFSKRFTIEIGNSKDRKHYVQEFQNNLSVIGEPKIKDYSSDKIDYTIVTFEPDLKKFGMKTLDDDIISLLKKRVYDMAGISPKSLKVFLNNEKLDFQTFEDYTNLYFNKTEPQKFCERFGDRWEICVAVQNQDQFQQVSFVNSICTIRGGTHVNHVSDQITTNLLQTILKKNKKLELKPYQIKQHLWIFINCLIENPAFDSQTKETLTSRPNTFGSKCEISDKFLNKIAKSGIIEDIVKNAEFKESMKLKKELGTGVKKKKLFGIPKLEDANLAGTSESESCILILTEGDSAKSLAMSGIQVVGRDRFGVFPLRGKLLNVRDAGMKQILENQEIQNIIKILGLYMGKDYQDLKSLRYGSIMIMADQDHDGSHIKGLIINFLHHFWPKLIRDFPTFVKEFITPIIKATKDHDKQQFFTIPEYEKWAAQKNVNELKAYRIKYYKGLGTSDASEAKQYFTNIKKHQIQFYYKDERDEDKILMAFSKNRAEDRKRWLTEFDPNIYIDHSKTKISFQEFVDKELIHFSNADNMRSIPQLLDGLKPGQRKIIFGCFKRKLKSEIKVAQLSGYIAEHTAYHHGEVSLQSTIVNMAQDFVGSNNLNLLMPNGQFGTRMMGGKESASARYIFTNLSHLARVIFNENDDPLLNFQIEEGLSIEPDFYVPIVPMILINGSEGIGTGWSTSIPCYSPIQIIHNIKRHLEGKPFLRMVPWYKGFTGEITPNDEDMLQYTVRGKFQVDKERNRLTITELPIGKWTTDYKNMLEELAKKDEILDITEFHQDNTVHFQLKLSKDAFNLSKMTEEEIEKKLKLTSSLNVTNLVLFDRNKRLRKYQNECEILSEFFDYRLRLYEKRKESMLKKIRQQYEKLGNKYRFISEIIDGKIDIYKKKKEEIVKLLKEKGYQTYQQIYGDQKQSILTIGTNNEAKEKGNNDPKKKKAKQVLDKKSDFNYLLEMKIFSFVEDQLINLKTKMEEIKQVKQELESKSAKDLWNEELDQLLHLYEDSLSRDDKDINRKIMRIQQKEYYGPNLNNRNQNSLISNTAKKSNGFGNLGKSAQNNDSSLEQDQTMVIDQDSRQKTQENIAAQVVAAEHRKIIQVQQVASGVSDSNQNSKTVETKKKIVKDVIQTPDKSIRSVTVKSKTESIKSQIRKRRRISDESESQESSDEGDSSESEFEEKKSKSKNANSSGKRLQRNEESKKNSNKQLGKKRSRRDVDNLSSEESFSSDESLCSEDSEFSYQSSHNGKPKTNTRSQIKQSNPQRSSNISSNQKVNQKSALKIQERDLKLEITTKQDDNIMRPSIFEEKIKQQISTIDQQLGELPMQVNPLSTEKNLLINKTQIQQQPQISIQNTKQSSILDIMLKNRTATQQKAQIVQEVHMTDDKDKQVGFQHQNQNSITKAVYEMSLLERVELMKGQGGHNNFNSTIKDLNNSFFRDTQSKIDQVSPVKEIVINQAEDQEDLPLVRRNLKRNTLLDDDE